MDIKPTPTIQLNAAESEAHRQHVAHLDAVKEWGTRIKTYAQAHFNEYENDRTLITHLTRTLNSVRGESDKLPERLVACWVNGICVPENYELHDALMNAIALPRVNGNSGGVQKRMDVTLLYSMIDERFKTSDPDSLLPPGRHSNRVRLTDAPTIGCERITDRRLLQRNAVTHHHFEDRLGMPPRRKDDQVAYGELDRAELSTLLGSSDKATKNASEFLCAFAARHELTREEMAEKAGCSKSFITLVQHGERLPGHLYLPKFKQLMDSYGSAYYPRFEALVISNRLHYVRELIEQERQDPEHLLRPHYAADVTNELNEIPQPYWESMVIRHNHSRAKSPPLPPNAPPEWVLDQMPIATRGDYLRAVRLALGHQIGMLAKLRLEPGELCTIEHYGNLEHEPIRERVMEHYQKLDAERMAARVVQGKPAGEAFFWPKAYQRLYSSKRIFKNPRVQHDGRVADAPEQASGFAIGGTATPPQPGRPAATAE